MNWQSDLNDLLKNRTKIPPNNKKCESDMLCTRINVPQSPIQPGNLSPPFPFHRPISTRPLKRVKP